jgi:hypothetical protein
MAQVRRAAYRRAYLPLRENSMPSEQLQRHFFSTYITLRYGMAAIAFAFPLLLLLLGYYYFKIPLQESMSANYFALSPDDAAKNAYPMRTWFVGILFAIGAFLYLYKGFSDKENWALNIAGICAIGVAIFPMQSKFGIHGIFAIVLFLCIAFVAIWCTQETLQYLASGEQQKRFKRVYTTLGLLMLASPATAAVLTLMFGNPGSYTFFVEAAGVLAFAAFWWTKSRELALSDAEAAKAVKEIAAHPVAAKAASVHGVAAKAVR